MIKVFVYGCTTCGINSLYIRRVQAYGRDQGIPVEVYNTKYDKELREEHAAKLAEASLDQSAYGAIVVDDNITELRKWKP